MNTMTLLREPHHFRRNDNVKVHERIHPDPVYDGRIYDIYQKPLQKGLQYSPIFDYFYITFDKNVYDSLLKKGWSIIYEGKECTLGSVERNENNEITKIHVLYELQLFGEKEIEVDKIDAILIWRVAYKIKYK